MKKSCSTIDEEVLKFRENHSTKLKTDLREPNEIHTFLSASDFYYISREKDSKKFTFFNAHSIFYVTFMIIHDNSYTTLVKLRKPSQNQKHLCKE